MLEHIKSANSAIDQRDVQAARLTLDEKTALMVLYAALIALLEDDRKAHAARVEAEYDRIAMLPATLAHAGKA